MRVHPAVLGTFLTFALLASACTGAGDAEPQKPTPAATWSVQTGIASVDAFLNLVAAANVDTIAAQTAFQPMECEEPDGRTDGPLLPCREGEAEGTVIDAIVRGCFPASAVRREELPDRLGILADPAALTLDAVYEVDVSNVTYSLLLTKAGTPPAPAGVGIIIHLTDDGRLAGYASCGEYTAMLENAVQLWP